MWEILIYVSGAASMAVLTGLWTVGRRRWDRRAVYQWMREHTRDEPRESHVDLVTIAKGAELSEERARHACITDKRIHRHRNHRGEETWSVWRTEPKFNPTLFVV